MTENRKPIKSDWTDPDDAPLLTRELAARGQISVGGKIVRKATGTLTKRGRPPIGDESKQQVTLRLPRDVISHFKAGGSGWQTRISDILSRHAHRDKRKRA